MTIFSLIALILLQVPDTRPTQLPDQLKRMILDEYPKSKLVFCAYDTPRQKKPTTFIQGDFNGDSNLDFAVIVNVDAPPPNCYCIVFISSDSQYTMNVLKEPYMYCSPNKTLTLNRKGSTVYNHATETGTVLINDAFTIYTEACWTFIYKDNKFTIITSCD